MTSRDQIEAVLRSLYAARLKEDLEGTLKDLSDDAVFRINGRDILNAPVTGKAAIRTVLKDIFERFQFEDWKERSLLVDGEKAALHWSARVTCTPTNKSATIETCDIVTFRDGKIVDYLQTTDTALVTSLAAS